MLRLVLAVTLLLIAVAAAAEPPRWTLKAKVRGEWLEGWPASWSDTQVQILGRDGYLHEVSPGDVSDYSRVAETFQPLSAGDMRTKLQREFGADFEVTGTGHYLVVHPAGQKTYWAERFEELYRSFFHYFAVRGLKPKESEFPLVAIIVKRPEDMMAYAAKEGVRIGPGVLGYYTPVSNRVILYDQGRGKASKKDWGENSATIIHEATHQTAFNTGVHSRFALPPRWVGEGLGTLFEAPGVWDSSYYRNQSDRINAGRLEDFKKIVAPNMNAGILAGFIASDRAFQTSPQFAYATAWALTFYLIETQPAKYCEYLSRTASRSPNEEPTEKQRLQEFTATFGRDFAMLNARFLRFFADLK